MTIPNTKRDWVDTGRLDSTASGRNSKRSPDQPLSDPASSLRAPLVTRQQAALRLLRTMELTDDYTALERSGMVTRARRGIGHRATG